jgi:capsular exopolysaccharide synthesis family protein
MMNNADNFLLGKQDKRSRGLSGVNPLVIFNLLKKNWYWFAIGIISGLFCARFYIGHTMPVYQTAATILINQTENRGVVDNTEILQGLGLQGGMQNIENQMMVLKSRDLTERTLRELPFEIEYYFKTMRNRLPIYPETPLTITSDSIIPLPRNTEFLIHLLGNNSFIIESKSDFFSMKKMAAFGENIQIANGSFRIDCRNEQWLNMNKDRLIGFIIYTQNNLVNYFGSRVNVELMSRGGSILKISLLGTNPAKDADFLNKHLENFQNISLINKNIEAERRIQFIDDQLVGVSDSLSTTETRLQQFRSSHRVMDLPAQSQSIIGQVTLLENERARLSLEANYYDYLADYLNKDVSGEIPIIPITMGITDPSLTRLVDELAALQAQLSSAGAGEMNPLQRNLEQRIRNAKEALRETLNGLRRANSLARSENQEQINRANIQASTLPITERQLLGIERKFKLNDELNTFLLETRAEQLMQKAANRADSEIVDRADERFSSQVAPDRNKIHFAGLFAGAGIPFIIIFLNFLFNKKLKEEDIRGLTDVPIVGNIPHSIEKVNTVVLDFPNSGIAESFRLLRSRMQFLTKEAISPVILITSSMPDDGKTFTAINLASVYSLLNKKTVLVGFDLRKPKIYNDFNLNNDNGISTWLIGKDKLDDIIQETTYKNLSVITAGPVPPNPSELTSLAKTDELIKLLRNKFDYIIIDTSPIGIVSDTYHLASMADVCLLVARAGKSLKDIFESTVNEIIKSELKSVSIVINDTKSDSKRYGYGEKYGYTKRTLRRSLF